MVQLKTASAEKPNLQVHVPATLKGTLDGPSLRTKPIPLESNGEDISESIAKEDEAGPSIDNVEKEMDTRKDKGDSKNVGGDVENQSSLGREVGNVSLQALLENFEIQLFRSCCFGQN